MEGDNHLPTWAGCELLVAYRLTDLGYAVSIPLQPQPYDLLVDTKAMPSRILRVQVKKAVLRAQRIRPKGKGDREHYNVTLSRRTRFGAPRARLKADEFDYLVVVCTPTQIYVIPTSLIQRQSADGAELRWNLEFKAAAENGRRDSARAASRWQTCLNNFNLAPRVEETTYVEGI